MRRTGDRAGGSRPPAHVGGLPQAIHDAGAAVLRGTIYVFGEIVLVGGYTGVQPQRALLGFAPGGAPQRIGTLPHPLRYAAAAAVGGRLVVAGGTDGVHAVATGRAACSASCSSSPRDNARPARDVRLAAAGPLFDRPHGDPALNPFG